MQIVNTCFREMSISDMCQKVYDFSDLLALKKGRLFLQFPQNPPLAGKQAVSIAYAYRIVLCVEVTEHEVILHNIGTHDEVYL